MPVYIALLRGINIGPHKRMKMERLRASCEGLGFKNVKSYIQSGNIVFQAEKLSPAALSKRMEECIASDFGFSADVISRTREEMGKIIERNPFLKEPRTDLERLHVVFLKEAPAAAAIKKLESLTEVPDKVYHFGQELYFCFPNGVSKSSLWKYPLDKVLSVSATMRNWNTVNALYEMAVECR